VSAGLAFSHGLVSKGTDGERPSRGINNVDARFQTESVHLDKLKLDVR